MNPPVAMHEHVYGYKLEKLRTNDGSSIFTPEDQFSVRSQYLAISNDIFFFLQIYMDLF